MGQLQDAIIEHGQGRFEMRPEGDEEDSEYDREEERHVFSCYQRFVMRV